MSKRYYNQKCKKFTNKNVGGMKVREKISVLIADDNPEFAMTLAGYLEKEDDMEVIGMARDRK